MKTITAFTHPTPAPDAQAPDTTPGNYYVSAGESGSAHFYTMLGPFVDDHAAALAAVETVRSKCHELDRSGKSHWMSYGTVRMASDFTRPGKLNQHLPHLLPTPV